MRNLQRPAEDPDAHFLTCIERIRNRPLRDRLRSIRPNVAAASAEFHAHAIVSSLHALPAQANVAGVVTTAEMVDVYDGRMARRRSPGRPVYDRLMALADFEVCPLCGQRTVSTIDHHLPKTRYPALVVTPVNLVPVCKDCNNAKGNRIPATAGEQTLHPYYDNIEGDSWLRGTVVPGAPAVVVFAVDAPAGWSPLLTQRVQFHFHLLELGKLYASHASVELRNIQYGLSRLHSAGGLPAVRAHLLSEAVSREASHRNSWQTAMYKALHQNNWFCNGGFAA